MNKKEWLKGYEVISLVSHNTVLVNGRALMSAEVFERSGNLVISSDPDPEDDSNVARADTADGPVLLVRMRRADLKHDLEQWPITVIPQVWLDRIASEPDSITMTERFARNFALNFPISRRNRRSSAGWSKDDDAE